MFSIYIIQHVDGRYYSGYSKNIALTIENFSFEHYNENGSNLLGYTQKPQENNEHHVSTQYKNTKREPIKLVYHQWPYTLEEAEVVAKHLAMWSYQSKQALITNNWPEISKMAKSLMF